MFSKMQGCRRQLDEEVLQQLICNIQHRLEVWHLGKVPVLHVHTLAEAPCICLLVWANLVQPGVAVQQAQLVLDVADLVVVLVIQGKVGGVFDVTLQAPTRASGLQERGLHSA